LPAKPTRFVLYASGDVEVHQGLDTHLTKSAAGAECASYGNGRVQSATRLPVLDGLRAISILLVLGAHMLPLGPKILQLNYTAGAMGMSLFFSLSGFLITSTLLHNPDVHAFLVRRLARIVPLAYAYAFLVFGFLAYDPNAFFWTATFLLNYFPEGMVDGYNNHFWSLCVEVHFYLAIALTVLVAGQRGIWIVWPACLAITALRIIEGTYINIQTHLRVDEILVGACIATLYQEWWKVRARSAAALVALAVIAWVISSNPYAGWLQYLRPYTTGAVLASVLCLCQGRLVAALSSAPMRYVAAISYALYVVHPLTIHGWWNQGTILERYVFKRPISFAMCFAAAHLSTFYWEKFWQRAARRWVERRTVRQARAAAVGS
jgi:peptidoglycan/LPS O-acetylase OafA/YrhL